MQTRFSPPSWASDYDVLLPDMRRIYGILVMVRLFTRLGILLAAFIWLANSALAREVIIYDYHLKPPFILDAENGKGLDFDIAEYLNSKQHRFHFRTVYVPRNRINARIATGKLDGLIIGVNELWFHDPTRVRFLWSPSYLPDEDVVVSLKSRPVEYTEPNSLRGLTVGFPQGYYYYGLSELADANKLNREYAPSEESNLSKLVARRINVTVVSRSTYNYLLKIHPEWRNVFYVSTVPEERFDRHLLIPLHWGEVQIVLSRILPQVSHDPAWQKILARYRPKATND